MNAVRRGEIWLYDPDPTRGHEQAGKRPGLVVSADRLHAGGSGLAIVLPLTTRDKGIPSHVRIDPPAGGIAKTSFIMCEQIRCISQQRLIRRLGALSGGGLGAVTTRLELLLDL